MCCKKDVAERLEFSRAACVARFFMRALQFLLTLHHGARPRDGHGVDANKHGALHAGNAVLYARTAISFVSDRPNVTSTGRFP